MVCELTLSQLVCQGRFALKKAVFGNSTMESSGVGDGLVEPKTYRICKTRVEIASDS